MSRRLWRNFDFVLLGTTILLIALGVAVIYSSTLGTPDLADLPYRQVIYAVVGLGIMFAVAAIDYRFLESFQKLIYIVTIALPSIVFTIGEITHGAQRWISSRGSVQPSELTKVLVIVILAKHLADHQEDLRRLRYVFLSLLYVIPPMILIYLQPDLSTAVVLAVIWLVMALMAGMRLLHLGVLGISGVLAAPLIWMTMKDYMRQRLLTFIMPMHDPLGSAYNINQARIAIGSGGWLGRGFAHGSQSQLHFLRVRHTDFTFSVLGEELGFVGALLLIILLVILLWRITRAASMARDTFGYLIACGVAATLSFQAVANIAMNLGLLPTTGIPLPFISYGGSSLITFLIAEGLVQSVVMRYKKIEF
ncbi:MAG TPA: rod shape-determining protein RodA [Anaerolineae bacterium]|nr:rod shape-determining protein RodA [Anaerolineae bacterium]